MGYQLYAILKEAYETATHSNNRFEKAVNSVEWDSKFIADGEIYFCKQGICLTVENLNPFTERWKPSMLFADNSLITF